MSNYQTVYDQKRYNNLKYKVNEIIKKLSSVNTTVEKLDYELKDKYQVDNDYNLIISRISDFKENVNTMETFLNNSVITAIEKELLDIKNK